MSPIGFLKATNDHQMEKYRAPYAECSDEPFRMQKLNPDFVRLPHDEPQEENTKEMTMSDYTNSANGQLNKQMFNTVQHGDSSQSSTINMARRKPANNK